MSPPRSTKVTDPNRQATTYTVDQLGRVTEVLDPLGKTVKTTYTAAGFVDLQTDQANKTTDLEYSADGRNNLTKVTRPTSAAESFTYDATHVFIPERPRTLSRIRSPSVTTPRATATR